MSIKTLHGQPTKHTKAINLNALPFVLVPWLVEKIPRPRSD